MLRLTQVPAQIQRQEEALAQDSHRHLSDSPPSPNEIKSFTAKRTTTGLWRWRRAGCGSHPVLVVGCEA
jgi:hypothetical protein